MSEATASALVRRFYDELWNKADTQIASLLLDPAFLFRSSLGYQSCGIEGFVSYVLSIHAALSGYRCTIEELVAGDSAAAARMTFGGIHAGPFMNAPPTGRYLEWAGAAFFRIGNNRISELWVLGDVDDLKQQLNANRALPIHQPGARK